MNVDNQDTIQDEIAEQVEMRMENVCDIMVTTNRNVHLEGLLAVFIQYRDYMVENIGGSKPVTGPQFIKWIKSHQREEDDFIAPWGFDVVEMIDDVLITVVKSESATPANTVAGLDQWVDKTVDEVKEIHDLPDNFFEID